MYKSKSYFYAFEIQAVNSGAIIKVLQYIKIAMNI